MRLPEEYKSLIKSKDQSSQVKNILGVKNSLNTVCDEAKCPNRGECYKKGTAAFLVMGDICTRNCTFCNVKKGVPLPLDNKEIDELVEAVIEMNLKYTVITSVTRDDIVDGGAAYINSMVKTLKKNIKGIQIEILIPDLNKNPENLRFIDMRYVDVLNHNMETVKEMYSAVRPMADYSVSLSILKTAKQMGFNVKTGIMTGVGETSDQIESLFDDVVKSGVDILTIGQYFKPGRNNLAVSKYYTSDEFDKMADEARKRGIKNVVSGIFVRSSYNAYETFKGAK